jgi:hypothetical protein
MSSTFKNSASSNIGTTPVVLYTTPGSTATTVIGLSLANILTATVYVTVVLTISGTDYNLIKAGPVPPGSSMIMFGGDQKLAMMAGHSVKISSSDAISIDAVMSYLELA